MFDTLIARIDFIADASDFLAGFQNGKRAAR
jgi:hypothetical protein